MSVKKLRIVEHRLDPSEGVRLRETYAAALSGRSVADGDFLTKGGGQVNVTIDASGKGAAAISVFPPRA